MNYVGMSGPALLGALGMDGHKWAAAFCQIAKTHGQDIDEGWMQTWFANAIMAGYDEAERRLRK